MKDYTKYDFDAIVGAEVEIRRQDLNTFKGTLVMSDEQLISVMIDDIGVIHYELKENILSLSAKIKIEDMTLKQLLRMMDEYKYRSPKLDENGIWFECSNGDKAVARFGKEIDCTDWGWENGSMHR